MANEIKALDGDGFGVTNILCVFPVAAPKQIGVPAVNVIPTPSSLLTEIASQACTAAEKAAFDAGTSAWRIIQFSNNDVLSGAALAVRVRELYAAANVEFQREYANRYRYTGQMLNP